MQKLDNTHPGFLKLLADSRKIARQNDIKIRISKAKYIHDADSDSKCIGYFDSEGGELASSNYNDFDVFIRNFVHESCHMDQFLKDKFLWEKCSPGYDIFFQWLEDKKIVKREVLEEAVQDIIRLEKDCEIRSIAKINKYKLPIDVTDYIKRANAYLYGYLFFLEQKKWLPAIYNNPDVVTVSPGRFPKEYKKIPRKLYVLFKRELNKTA